MCVCLLVWNWKLWRCHANVCFLRIISKRFQIFFSRFLFSCLARAWASFYILFLFFFFYRPEPLLYFCFSYAHMGWQFNVCYILRLYYDWDVIATDYKAGPYIVYNTFPAGKKSNKARCVCLSFRFVRSRHLHAQLSFLSIYGKGRRIL